MSSEVAGRADFSIIRYAQCWEDADVLVQGLDVRPGDVCLSVCSAGDNSLALLTRSPRRVIAVDLSDAQLACLELRVAAYRALEHEQMLELMGSRQSSRRGELYRKCRDRGGLGKGAAAFWNARGALIERGIGAVGKFEDYFAMFRRWVLPLVHSRRRVERLMRGGSRAERVRFYEEEWDTRRWRWMFGVFFSRWVMGRLGRDPSFFKYVEGSVGDRILERTRHALTELDPAANPYIHWILTGTHGDALPLALRLEHFETIRANLDRLSWRRGSVESWLDENEAAGEGRVVVDRFNLSDIFEYMSEGAAGALLRKVADASRQGSRLLYWNMLAPRSRPEALADRLTPLEDLAAELFREDKAFFYSRVVIEEVSAGGAP